MQMHQIYFPYRAINNYVIGVFMMFFLFPGIYYFSTGDYSIGLFLIILWISLFTLKKGVKIDYANKQLYLFSEFIGLRLYSYKNLKNYSGYRIRRVSKSYTFSSEIQSTSINHDFLSIELFNKKNKKTELILLGNSNLIIGVADRMENELGLPKVKSHLGKML